MLINLLVSIIIFIIFIGIPYLCFRCIKESRKKQWIEEKAMLEFTYKNKEDLLLRLCDITTSYYYTSDPLIHYYKEYYNELLTDSSIEKTDELLSKISTITAKNMDYYNKKLQDKRDSRNELAMNMLILRQVSKV